MPGILLRSPAFDDHGYIPPGMPATTTTSPPPSNGPASRTPQPNSC
jgi:hypothetical protein